MAYYKPCKNCAIDPDECQKRQALKQAFAGLHVTSVNFVCRERRPMFHAGDRVEFPWSHWEPTDWGDSLENKLIFMGTVVYENGTRFVVRVDDADGQPADANSEAMKPGYVFRSDRLVTKVKPSDLTLAGQERREICQSCTAYSGEAERCQGYGELGHWDSYWPSECINKPSPEPRS